MEYLVVFGCALVYAAAAFCLYLMIFNRYLLVVPDSRFKKLTMIAVFAVIVGGFTLTGISLSPRWTAIPAVMLAVFAAGEVRRLVIRRIHAGSAPVETTEGRLDLFKPLTTTDLVTRRYEIRISKWNGKRLRIAHLTDLHVHPYLPAQYYREVLEAMEHSKPDVVFITGDFLANAAYLPQLKEVLMPLKTVRCLAVLGNHDYWANPGAVRSVLGECGIEAIGGRTVTLQVCGGELQVSGYEYPWGTRELPPVPARPDLLQLVLSHTPDNIYRLARRGYDGVFSGHCHAGQARIPFIGSVVVPSVYGRRFDHGHFVVKGSHLFIAGGVGAGDPPMRVYCNPDIFLVDVEGNSAETGKVVR